jgi:hypothetical protein
MKKVELGQKFCDNGELKKLAVTVKEILSLLKELN